MKRLRKYLGRALQVATAGCTYSLRFKKFWRWVLLLINVFLYWVSFNKRLKPTVLSWVTICHYSGVDDIVQLVNHLQNPWTKTTFVVKPDLVYTCLLLYWLFLFQCSAVIIWVCWTPWSDRKAWFLSSNLMKKIYLLSSDLFWWRFVNVSDNLEKCFCKTVTSVSSLQCQLVLVCYAGPRCPQLWD